MSLSGDFGMPHKFNKIVPDAHIFLDANILDDKPGMAILVTKIFATWAQIEHELSVLLIRVLGANAAPAIAMHTALTAQHLQNTALQAAAKVALSPDDFDIFQAALSTTESTKTPRNHLAHWIWGGCKQRPDLLALADPEMIKERDHRVAKFYHENPDRDVVDIVSHAELYYFDTSSVLAYSEDDLKRALRDLKESQSVMLRFGLYLNPPSVFTLGMLAGFRASNEEIRVGLLHKLNDSRLFREALGRIRKGRSSTPSENGGSHPPEPPGS